MDSCDRSLRDFGFLSPHVNDFIASHRGSHSAWFKLAENLNLVGQRQVQRGADKALKLSSLDPINLGVRLLLRTMSNFQGCIILIERGMVVEAQTLIRNCYENGFWIGAFFSKPIVALEAFKLDEAKSQDARAAAVDGVNEKHGDPAMKSRTRQQFANRRTKASGQKLGIENVAIIAGLHPNFVFYKELSANSAHASLNSIERYLELDSDGNWLGFLLGAGANEEIGFSLNLACHALISALAAAGQLLGNTDDDQILFDMNKGYEALAGIQK